MVEFRTIKGTHDLLPDELSIWRLVENSIHSSMQQNGYYEIRTPVFENTDLFVRGIGTGTDIVTKEMYTWIDLHVNAIDGVVQVDFSEIQPTLGTSISELRAS